MYQQDANPNLPPYLPQQQASPQGQTYQQGYPSLEGYYPPQGGYSQGYSQQGGYPQLQAPNPSKQQQPTYIQPTQGRLYAAPNPKVVVIGDDLKKLNEQNNIRNLEIQAESGYCCYTFMIGFELIISFAAAAFFASNTALVGQACIPAIISVILMLLGCIIVCIAKSNLDASLHICGYIFFIFAFIVAMASSIFAVVFIVNSAENYVDSHTIGDNSDYVTADSNGISGNLGGYCGSISNNGASFSSNCSNTQGTSVSQEIFSIGVNVVTIVILPFQFILYCILLCLASDFNSLLQRRQRLIIESLKGEKNSMAVTYV